MKEEEAGNGWVCGMGRVGCMGVVSEVRDFYKLKGLEVAGEDLQSLSEVSL